LRFERWEQLGVDVIRTDLEATGGLRMVGGSPAVRKLAWEWVRMKEAGLKQYTDQSAHTAAYTREAAKAVYAAIERLVAAGERAYSLSVPIEAENILVGWGAGKVSRADAGAQVKAAIVRLSDQGKIEAHAEGRKDWLIKEPLEPEFPTMTTIPTEVFVVHRHDNGARDTVARFIEKLGFKAIILHERPNKGRTIITKFREESANVGFAVVLMTPDDHGGKTNSETRPRARQNVVFELGFFIGALGADKVAALLKGDIERPSDFDGVVYISLDYGNWKVDLGRELEAAGFQVDWKKVGAA
jgi:predicted nucleotide-binding protein